MPSEVVYKPIEKTKPIFAGGTITPPKFTPSYYEWLFKDKQQIIKTGRTTGDLTIYTVPDGFTLFMVNCYLTEDTTSNFWCALTYGGGFTPIIEFQAGAQTDNSIFNINYNFIVPVAFQEKTIITVRSQGTPMASGGFVGFLVENSAIPTF